MQKNKNKRRSKWDAQNLDIVPKQQNWQEEEIQKTNQKVTKSCICKAKPKAPQTPNEKQNVKK
jgi:hypothetical protein